MREDASSSRTLDFLYFGYLPTIPPDSVEQSWHNVAVDPDIEDLSDREIRRLAAEALIGAVDPSNSSINVVHLSGGNDSRAILAALLEHCEASSLIAVTYGTPGTYDFDIPQKVSKRAGVRHALIDLSRTHVSVDDLVRTADGLPRPSWLFGPWANRLVADRFGSGATYWSGYLGGPVTGSHRPLGEPSTSWKQAVAKHADRPGFGRSGSLFHSSYSPVDALPQDDASFESPLTMDEQVDLLVRQHPWLYPEHAVDGFEQKFPFLDPLVLRIFFNAGIARRNRQELYLSLIQERFSGLFSNLPHKDHMGIPASSGSVRKWARLNQLRIRRGFGKNFGRWGKFPPPGVNHIDWNYAFKHRPDFRELAQTLLPRLASRDVIDGVDPVAVYDAHLSGKVELGLFLTQLISLEIWIMEERFWSQE